MADRTVTARLRLEYAQFVAGTSKASAEMRKLAVETVAATNKNQESFKKVGLAAAGAAAVIGVGFYKAEQSIMSFDKQMSGVAAVTSATSDEMDRLRNAAIAAGANTKLAGVSASEAAAAEAELVKAGVSVNEVLGGALIGSLSLASAGQIEFGDAAIIAAQAMNVWNLSGRDVGHVADVIAAAANKSAANVSDIGEAVRQGGLVAAGANQSLEQTVGTLALFADNALIGSDAGTSLKTMLLQLQGPSTTARDTMKQLGLSVYDSTGNFVGMDELAGRLQKTLGGLAPAQRDAAIAMIFGNDAARAARILYDSGEKKVRDYIKAVDDQGAAADMAAKQMDNLSGDVENLGGAIEAAILKNGAGATGGLRMMTQAATGMVNQFAAMPGPVAAAGGGLLALTGAGLGVVGLAGTLIPRVREARTELEKLGRAGELANKGLGFAGKAGAYAAGILVLSEAIHALALKTDEWLNGKPDIEATTGALFDMAQGSKKLDDVLHAGRTNLHEIRQGIDDLGDSTISADKHIRGSKLRNELEDIDKALAAMVTSGSPKQAAALVRELASTLGLSPKELKAFLGAYTEAAGSSTVASKAAASAAKEAGAAFEGQKDPVQDVADALDDYSDALAALYDKSFAVMDATDQVDQGIQDFASSVLDARDSGDAFATSLDATSRQGLTNRETLRGLVQDVLGVAEAMVRQGASAGEVNAMMVAQRDRLIDVVTQLGFSRTEASSYIDTLLKVPTSLNTTITVDTNKAQQDIAVLIGQLERAGVMVDKVGVGLAYASGQLAPPTPPPITSGRQLVNTAPRSSNSGSKPDVASYLEGLWRARMEAVENRFKAGEVSLEDYERSLDEQMAREIPWTNAWVALQEKKADAVKYWSDKVGVYLHLVQDHQRMVEDNMFAVADLGKDRYLEILQERLAGLEKYSDEWLRVWQLIKQVSGEALDMEIAVIQAYEEGRLFQQAWDILANQRMLSDAYLTPASSYSTASTTTNSTTWSPTFNAYGSDSLEASATNNQKLRDYAALAS